MIGELILQRYLRRFVPLFRGTGASREAPVPRPEERIAL
jgi:hypothetical protein